ncbi:membrane protein DedA with SNARE-associated domain [Murinocardiopsis flavida]|uniref:Membrane protein DedA with SNARE-associated domain n=1 Tax=Murinocardiopsis flavida TaxID=645275 RepID=A0A2P8DSM1_9ACTN|nr:VTT domain-containing protein [Murinocardiopsis flavida]PSL00214.1 membrane protein DedA with SNARE-associated domain [Murinocardiopsis flavida]
MTAGRTDLDITSTSPRRPAPDGSAGGPTADGPAADAAPGATTAASPPQGDPASIGQPDRPYLPWRGKATRTDKALLGAILGVLALMLVLWPLRPYLIASHPVLLAFVTGSKAAVGAAAAYARIGEVPLWLAVLAGTVGMSKFDWLFWWTGRQWGRGIVNMFAQGERARKLAEKTRHMNPWFIRTGVVLAVLPGVPSALVYALAGWTGMRPATFIVLNVLGSLLMAGLVAGIGYGLGQAAVDLVIAIDDKAIWISIGIVTAISVASSYKAQRAAARKKAA